MAVYSNGSPHFNTVKSQSLRFLRVKPSLLAEAVNWFWAVRKQVNIFVLNSHFKTWMEFQKDLWNIAWNKLKELNSASLIISCKFVLPHPYPHWVVVSNNTDRSFRTQHKICYYFTKLWFYIYVIRTFLGRWVVLWYQVETLAGHSQLSKDLEAVLWLLVLGKYKVLGSGNSSRSFLALPCRPMQYIGWRHFSPITSFQKMYTFCGPRVEKIQVKPLNLLIGLVTIFYRYQPGHHGNPEFGSCPGKADWVFSGY